MKFWKLLGQFLQKDEVFVMQAAFQCVVNCKMLSWGASFRRQRESCGVLNWDCRENKGENWKVQTAICQAMASVLCDSEGFLLVEFFKRGTTISSEQYVRTLKKIKWIWRVGPKRKMNQVLIASWDYRFSTSWNMACVKSFDTSA
jgi:hypothetical protein